MNVYYDDEEVLERISKARYGKDARLDDLTNGSDLVYFFPALASEIIATALRRELQTEDLKTTWQRLEYLKNVGPTQPVVGLSSKID